MKKTTRVVAVGASLALGVLGLTACSSGSGGSDNGGSGSSGGDTGPITYVQGKDTSGVVTTIASEWNAKHPNEKVTVKQQSDKADQQFQDLTQHFQQKLSDYDVVSVDVIWTAGFAAKQYLQPLTGAYKIDTSAFLPSVVKSGQYVNVQYAAPASTDSQLLYYRKDLLGSKAVPTTWDEMMGDCGIAKSANIGCYAGQFAKYEGLAVNFNEAVSSEGGTITNPSNNQPTLDTAAAKAGLQRLVTAFKDGNIPKAALSYQEAGTLNAFETGKLLFATNWPYMVNDIQTATQAAGIRDKYGIAGYPGHSAVGGHNLAISNFSKHKATAKAFIEFMESDATQRELIAKASLAPIRSDLYTDTTLTDKYPYLIQLKKSLDNATARPSTPYYQGVSLAIQNNIFPALNTAASGGTVDVDAVLKATASAITAASSS